MIPRRKINLYDSFNYHLVRWILSPQFRKKNFFDKFEKRLKEFFNVNSIFLLSSGRSALDLIFKSIKYNPGDEIIVPNYTLKSLIEIIKEYKLKVKLIDISIEDFCIDLNKLEKCINKRTKIVMLTHMFGYCGDLDKFLRIVKRYNLLVIEDCAHAFGSEYKNKKLGTFGDFSFFSFDYIKPINTMGGGALIINNKKYIDKIKLNYSKLKKTKFSTNLNKVCYYYFQIMLLSKIFFRFTKCLIENKFSSYLFKEIHKNAGSAPRDVRLSNFQCMVGYNSLEKWRNKSHVLKCKYELLKKNLNPKLKARLHYQSKKNNEISHYFLTLKTNGNLEHTRKMLSKKGVDVGIKDEIMDLCSNLKRFKNSISIYNSLIQIPFYNSLDDKSIVKIAKILNNYLI